MASFFLSPVMINRFRLACLSMFWRKQIITLRKRAVIPIPLRKYQELKMFLTMFFLSLFHHRGSWNGSSCRPTPSLNLLATPRQWKMTTRLALWVYILCFNHPAFDSNIYTNTIMAGNRFLTFTRLVCVSLRNFCYCSSPVDEL